MMQIDLKKVNKTFDKKPIIKNISMQINAGEMVCLLGPSGSGKTTLIRLILGAINADDGQITIKGIKVPNLSLLPKIGYMPQNDALYQDLTGSENLAFYAGLYQMDKKVYQKEAEVVLKVVDLLADKDKLVSKYSGGMKKRLSLAIAILHNPDILLLDEPTVGIDPVLRKNIWTHFKTLQKAGKTLVISTHVMDEISLCDKAALIYDGKLIAYDEIANLRRQTNTNIEELFFTAAKVGEV